LFEQVHAASGAWFGGAAIVPVARATRNSVIRRSRFGTQLLTPIATVISYHTYVS